MKLIFSSLLLVVAAAVAAAVPVTLHNPIVTAPEPSIPSNSAPQDPTSIVVPSSDPSATNNSRSGSSGPASSTDVSPASTDTGVPTSSASVQESSTSVRDSSEVESQTSSTDSLTSTGDARTSTPGRRSSTSDVASTTPSDVPPPSQTSTFSSSSSSRTVPSMPTATSPTVDKQTYLDQHNRWRARVGADDLQWSDDLAAKAQNYANECKLQHSNGALGPVGENLVAGTGSFSAEDAMSQFVLDRRDFNPSDLAFSHFTQVIWSSTTQLGCGVATCNELFPGHGAATYHVCLYDPVGNVVGEEMSNLPHFG